MKLSYLMVVGAVIAIGVTVPMLLQHRGEAAMREDEGLFQKQSSLIAEISAENRRLSNVAAHGAPSPPTNASLAEVLKLRNEVTQLRHLPEEIESVQQKIVRLKDRLQDAAEEESFGPVKNTALLVEEAPMRQARVVRLKKWLETMPQELIPELQFVSEDRWLNRVDRPLITDDDYRSAIGGLRWEGQQRFVRMLFNAVKGYAKANNDQFPSDLSQLKPYFEKPVDETILERWTIVPAKSLVPILAETGGDRLITQKAPINANDGRDAIGLTGYRGTVGEGSWDPVQ